MNPNSKLKLLPGLVLAIGSAAVADITMRVGDGTIDGAALNPYRLTWQQCVLQDDQWQAQPPLEEELVLIGDAVLRLRQTVRQPNGTVSRSNTYFDRSSLAPLRMETEATMNGERLAYAERVLTEDGYSGIAVKGADSKQLQGSISSRMLHGGALGLPLAAMAYASEPVAFPASMVGFDATYDVIAEWAGKEKLQFEGREIEAWLVDVEWHHRESGDVYPPGPDASGGRYWVVASPPAGYPYVPRYKTDTYAVEFDTETCPEASN